MYKLNHIHLLARSSLLGLAGSSHLGTAINIQKNE